MNKEEDYYCQSESETEIEDSVTLDSVSGGSWWSFIMGGLFANWLKPGKNQPVSCQEITYGNQPDGKERKPLITTQDEKDFLASVWLLEKEIKKAEQKGAWVRLYCLLQTVRHLCNNNWKKFTDGDYPFQDFLNDNILSLLYYVLDMDPETIYWPKISQQVKEALEEGDLKVEFDDFSYTFNGKPLREEPWSEDDFSK